MSISRERVLPQRPIEEVRAETLDLLKNLFREVQAQEREELTKKAKVIPLERAVANALFINDRVAPLIDELWVRKGDAALTLATDSLLEGLQFLGVERIEYGSYSNYKKVSNRSDWGYVQEAHLTSASTGALISSEDIPQQFQDVWDQNQGGNRRLIQRFGNLTKTEIVAMFGDFIQRKIR